MPILANSRHERFAQGLAAGKTAEQAYTEAGYNPSRSSASRLSTNANIQARLAELQARIVEGVVLTKQWVIDRLIENANRAMQTEMVMRDGKETGGYRYDGSVANRALELLGKEVGMFIDRKETRIVKSPAEMSDDELAGAIESARQRRLAVSGGASAKAQGSATTH